MKVRTIGVALTLMMLMGAALASPLETQQQIDILAKTGVENDGWFVTQAKDDNWDKWQYAVTDLDHDGKLEILKAKGGFYDMKPRLECEELLDKNGTRKQAALNFAGSAHVPDVLSSETAGQPKVIREKDRKRTYYIFEEILMHGEFESDTSKYAVCLEEDLLIAELATKNWRLSGKDGSVKVKYYISDPLRKKVSEKRYKNILAERFPGAVEKEGRIQWLSAQELWTCLEKGNAGDLLKKSYHTFEEAN